MKLRITVGIALLAVCLPASAAKVYIDYDKTYDRSEVQTFQWKETEGPTLAQTEPLLHSRVVNGIEYYLTEGGLREVESEPDVYVTYHTDAKEEMQLNTSNYGYGYGGGWYHDPRWGYAGMGYSTTSVTTYTRGTLIIDIWDAGTKEILWRGSATDIVPENPQKAGKTIDKWLRAIVYEWGNLKDREARAKAKEEKRKAKEAKAKG